MSDDATTASDSDSVSSADSCGPAAPAEVREDELESRLSGRMRVFTKGGCPTLESVAGGNVEMWSGRRWVVAAVAEAAPRPDETVLRVGLTDGSRLVCSGAHPWALVVEPDVRAVRTDAIQASHLSAPYVAMDPDSLEGTTDPQAYMHGYQFGKRVTDKRGAKLSVPASAFQLEPRSLGFFVAGWIDAQGGSFFGTRAVIHDLKILLCRIGVCHTRVHDMGVYRTLVTAASDGARIPNPSHKTRSFRGTRRKPYPRVVSVSEEPRTHRLYTITAPDTHLVVVDGVLTIC